MIPVSASPRVRAWLRRAGDGPVGVVHRGRDAVYLDVAGRCVGVVGARATAVPCALRTTADRLEGRRAHVSAGLLHLDGAPLRIGRLVDVRVPRLRASGSFEPPVAPDPVAAQLGTVPAVLTTADVRRLVGRGDGLTPLGDDVVCGWLAVQRAIGVETTEVDAAVRAFAHRTTLLSATLLDCALHGEVIPEFSAYLSALATPSEDDRATALAAVGHTSGTGMLYGARLALSALHPAGVPA